MIQLIFTLTIILIRVVACLAKIKWEKSDLKEESYINNNNPFYNNVSFFLLAKTRGLLAMKLK